MKKLPLVLSLTLTALSLTNSFADNLLQVADGGFETLPESGMSIHKSPEAMDTLKVQVVSEGASVGNGCLEIDLPVAANASISFPLQRSSKVGTIRFAHKGELGGGASVKFGLQSFKMEDGFKQVEFKPFSQDSKITKNWDVHSQSINLAEGATHWQVSIAIKGPAKLWIDDMVVSGE